jgi:hypothetical protein
MTLRRAKLVFLVTTGAALGLVVAGLPGALVGAGVGIGAALGKRSQKANGDKK